MTSFLLFRLHGPMSAWGDIAVGEFRPSVDHPSRSAMMGLIAAALGIDRTDQSRHDQLNQQFRLGISVVNAGVYLRDFHSIQFPTGKGNRDARTRKEELSASTPSTVLTHREYICDATYTIALWHSSNISTPNTTLDDIQQALSSPMWHLYLGRKSCPAGCRLEPKIIEAPTLREALDQCVFVSDQWLNRHPNTPQTVFWDGRADDPQVGFTSTLQHTRHDRPGHRSAARSFSPRTEFQAIWQPSQGGA